MGSSTTNKQENFYKAYKRMFFINKMKKDKICFSGFFINIKAISNFIKIIQDLKLNNDNPNNVKEIIENAFKNYKPEQKIKLYYSFKECEYILNQNL